MRQFGQTMGPPASQSMATSQFEAYEDGDFCTPADQAVEEVQCAAGEPSPFHKKSRSCFRMSGMADSLDTDVFDAHRRRVQQEPMQLMQQEKQQQSRGSSAATPFHFAVQEPLGCGGTAAAAPDAAQVPIFDNPFAVARAATSGGGGSRKRAAEGRFSFFDQENRRAALPRHMRDFCELTVCGDGGFSKVWQARGRLDGALYALKAFKKASRSNAAKKLALREVHALAALATHPHIVRYYATWMEAECVFIQFELCPRGSLWDAMQRWSTRRAAGGYRSSSSSSSGVALGGSAPSPDGVASAADPVDDALLSALLRDVSSALAHMHTRGIVHLDVKPHNILLSGEAESKTTAWTFKLADFGHAQSVASGLDVEQGDVRYLAADLLNAQEGTTLAASDVFSLGATAYEVASKAALPKTGDEWHRIRDGELRPTRSINRTLRRCLELMLHPQPTARPSAAQLHAHLLSAAGGGGGAAAASVAEAERLRAQCEALKRQLELAQARAAELEVTVGQIFAEEC